jgi:calcineurin-like phosphoesterase
MRVLFVGDVVGPEAIGYLCGRLPELRREHRLDAIVVNAENCGPTGVGMTVASIERLLACGVDVITAGNHAFDGPESARALAHPRVLRPLNLRDGVAGRGAMVVPAGDARLTVAVLADRDAMALVPALRDAFLPPYEGWLGAPREGAVLVDFHAQSVMAKQSFAHAVDGQAAAVLGTHTHEPTLSVDVLPGGTALVTEVGMTGARSGPQGFDPARFIALARGVPRDAAPAPAPARGPITLGAVFVEIERGRAVAVRRLR